MLVLASHLLFYNQYFLYMYFFMCKDALGTTDFVLSDGTIIFRTHPQEKDKLIFQIVSTCVLVVWTMNKTLISN